MFRGDQTARDVSPGFADLIGIGQMQLRPLPEPRRSQRHFPTANQRLGKCDRNEDIGFAQIIMIEEIVCASAKGVRVEAPALVRDRHAELIFFVPFAIQGAES